jgi:hypothetical protein
MRKKRVTASVRIRLTPEERAAVAAAAHATGLGPSTYARMTLVKAAGRKPAPAGRLKPELHAIALAKWTGAMGAIGNNLNQLARACNSGAGVAAADVAEVLAEVRKLHQTVLAYNIEQGDAPCS